LWIRQIVICVTVVSRDEVVVATKRCGRRQVKLLCDPIIAVVIILLFVETIHGIVHVRFFDVLVYIMSFIS